MSLFHQSQKVDSNYNEHSAAVSGSESELTKLRIKNQALQELLKGHLLKTALQNDEDDTATSSITLPEKTNNTITPEILHTHTTQTEARIAKKEVIQILTLEIPVVTERQSIFERLSIKDASPKTWAEQDLRRLIDSTVAGKAIPHTPRDLARKLLDEQNGSQFTQRIVDAPPPKKIMLRNSTSIMAKLVQPTISGIINKLWHINFQMMQSYVEYFVLVYGMQPLDGLLDYPLAR